MQILHTFFLFVLLYRLVPASASKDLTPRDVNERRVKDDGRRWRAVCVYTLFVVAWRVWHRLRYLPTPTYLRPCQTWRRLADD